MDNAVRFCTDVGLTRGARSGGEQHAKSLFMIVGILVGAAIALRLRVFTLVPVIAFMLAIAAMIGIVRGEPVFWMAAVAAISVQLGYLGGGALRYALRVKLPRGNNADRVR